MSGPCRRSRAAVLAVWLLALAGCGGGSSSPLLSSRSKPPASALDSYALSGWLMEEPQKEKARKAPRPDLFRRTQCLLRVPEPVFTTKTFEPSNTIPCGTVSSRLETVATKT